MKTADLLEALERFGLSDAESKAIYQLGRLGEATATELAKETGLSRAEVYRTMDALEARGLIERTIDRPQRFLPRPIEEALDRLMQAERERVAGLATAKSQLVEHWPRGKSTTESDEDRFQVQRGNTQIEGSITRMLEKAEHDIVLAAPHRTVNRLLARGLGSGLENAMRRGVQVRVLTQLTADLLAPGAIPDGAQVRHSDVPLYAQFLIVDQKEIAVWVTADPVVGATGRGETVLWINAVDFVMGQQTLFDELWLVALDPEARKEEIHTGRRPHDVRVARGRAARIDEMRDLASRARETIRLSVTASDHATLLDRLGPILLRAAKRGTRIQVLAPQPFLAAEKSIDHRKGTSHPEFTQLIADDAEVLISLPHTENEARDWALITTVAPVAKEARAAFEAAWSAGK